MNNPLLISELQALNPESLMAAIRDARLSPCQLNAGRIPSRLTRVMTPNLCLDVATLGPAFHFTGAMSPNHYTLIFVTACRERGRSFNFAIEHNDGYLGFFPPGGTLDAVTPEGYANATLTVAADVFHTALARHFPEIPETLLARGAGLRVGEPEQIRLRELLAELRVVLANSPDALAAAPAWQRLESDLLAAFLAAMRNAWQLRVPVRDPRVTKRLRRLRQANDFLTAHLDQPVYLDDLCAEVALTPRAVENLFRDLLGVNPIPYLRRRRLHAARQALRQSAAGPGVVKHVALQFGCWHLGRFARDYRALFGESPAETASRPD